MTRIMWTMSVDYTAEYLQHFSFPVQNIVHIESLVLGSAFFIPVQAARGYAVMVNGDFLVDPWFISRIGNDQDGVIFKAKSKVVCPECDISVTYGDTQKSNVLENSDVGDVAISREQRNVSALMPQLGQADQALVVKTGTQEYVPHVINTPLVFPTKNALNTNILGEPGQQDIG